MYVTLCNLNKLLVSNVCDNRGKKSIARIVPIVQIHDLYMRIEPFVQITRVLIFSGMLYSADNFNFAVQMFN